MCKIINLIELTYKLQQKKLYANFFNKVIIESLKTFDK